jgi:hypothetical protein
VTILVERFTNMNVPPLPVLRARYGDFGTQAATSIKQRCRRLQWATENCLDTDGPDYDAERWLPRS